MVYHRIRRTLGWVIGGACVVAVQFMCGPTYSDLEDEPVRAEMSLTRAQCVAVALRNNLNIKVSQIDPLKADANVTQAWGTYDAQVTSSLTVAEDKQPGGLIDVQGLPIRAPSSTAEHVRGQVGLQGQIPTGASYDMSYDSTRFGYHAGALFGEEEDLPAEYTGQVRLQLTQSLLRGLGLDVNLTQIRTAAANKEVSEFDLKRVLMQTVADVQSAYWELVFAREDLGVKNRSLEVARDLLQRNQRKFALGDGSQFLVDEAEAGVATREAETIAARAAVRDAEDELKRVMNMSDTEEYWGAEIVPADQAEMVERIVDLDEEIRLARNLRPEVMQTKKNIEIAEMNESYERNQLLPQLDVFGSYGFNSREPTYHREIEYMTRADDYSYSYGLTGSIPIGNRAAKGRRIIAEYDLKQAKLRLKVLERDIGVEVRRAVRSVATNRRLTGANRTTRELRRKTLEDEQTRFEIGLSTSYRVLEKVEDLAQARSNELRAIVDYRKAIVALDLADGTILTKNNIEFFSDNI